MSAQAAAPKSSRRHSSAGEATRDRLMIAAERLFAINGVEGVTLREIQDEAGQSNVSVIAYHFGSKAALLRALLQFRYRGINARRAELLAQAKADGIHDDPRAAVWLIVRPLVESIADGQMFVPLLAQLTADTRTLADYLPDDNGTVHVLREMMPEWSTELPDRIRLGREVQLYSSVLNLLGEHARSQHRISEAQLYNYIDGWVGMLSAPVTAATQKLMDAEETPSKRVGRTRR